MAEEKPYVAKINKTDDIEIRGTVTKYKNEHYVDFREYIDTARYQGPTKKGIRFHIENWESFKEMVEKVDEEIKKLF